MTDRYTEALEERRQRERDAAVQQSTEGAPLFEAPADARGLVRRTDPDTSHAAAERIADGLTELQRRVFAAFLVLGPMTAKEAEKLPRFQDLGFSTVRKRVSELAAKDHLVARGTRDGGTVYAARVLGDLG